MSYNSKYKGYEIEALLEGASEAKTNSEKALIDAEIAKNAVATLEGLANATTAMETLAAQVLQIEENKQKLSELQDELNGLNSSSITQNVIDYDNVVKSINHRGFNTIAPENTIPAYILSRKKGYKYVECDVSFTKDGVAVLLHDSTIDRTSDGSGNINSLTYEQCLQYDFGSWKSTEYKGTKIPTFKEFIILCKHLGLHPYIELKNSATYSSEQIQSIVMEVYKAGMKGKVTYISFNATYLSYVKEYDAYARLGYVVNPSGGFNSFHVQTCVNLKSDTNEVFLDARHMVGYLDVTEEKVQMCIDANIPLEIWSTNDKDIILEMSNYISGVTTDELNVGKILYENALSNDVDVEINIPATGIELSSNSLTFDGSETKTLVVTVYPSNSTDVVVWSSSDSSVATVSNGIVTSKGNGSAIITAKAGSVSAQCNVLVSGFETESPDIPEEETKTLPFQLKGSDFVQGSIRQDVYPYMNSNSTRCCITNTLDYRVEGGNITFEAFDINDNPLNTAIQTFGEDGYTAYSNKLSMIPYLHDSLWKNNGDSHEIPEGDKYAWIVVRRPDNTNITPSGIKSVIIGNNIELKVVGKTNIYEAQEYKAYYGGKEVSVNWSIDNNENALITNDNGVSTIVSPLVYDTEIVLTATYQGKTTSLNIKILKEVNITQEDIENDNYFETSNNTMMQAPGNSRGVYHINVVDLVDYTLTLNVKPNSPIKACIHLAYSKYYWDKYQYASEWIMSDGEVTVSKLQGEDAIYARVAFTYVDTNKGAPSISEIKDNVTIDFRGVVKEDQYSYETITEDYFTEDKMRYYKTSGNKYRAAMYIPINGSVNWNGFVSVSESSPIKVGIQYQDYEVYTMTNPDAADSPNATTSVSWDSGWITKGYDSGFYDECNKVNTIGGANSTNKPTAIAFVFTNSSDETKIPTFEEFMSNVKITMIKNIPPL